MKQLGNQVVVQRGEQLALFRMDRDEARRAVGLDVLREIWVEDVYHLDGLDLADRVVVDVGAHIGAFSIRAALMGAQVLAFEPEAHSRQHLHANAKLNNVFHTQVLGSSDTGSVTPVTAAVGDSSVMHLGQMDDTGMLSIDAPGSEPYDAVSLRHAVELFTIEDAAILKIDVEGAEHLVIEGAIGVLHLFERIEIETHAMPDERLGPMLAHLLHTHSISAFGHPDRGGMLSARRY